MTMLAWLMRGGWVTQLCTFAYVVVWPEIIYEVEYALEAEEIAKAKRAQAEGGEPRSLDSNTTATSSSSGTEIQDPTEADVEPRSFSSTSEPTTDLASSTATLRDLTLSPTQLSIDHPLSPTSTSLSPHSPSRTTSPSQTHHHPAPTPAELAAEKARLERLASRAAQTLADKATSHARKAPPLATPHPSINDAPHLLHLSPHIILDAKKATGRESLFLDAIGRRLAKGAEGKGKGKEDGHHKGITNQGGKQGGVVGKDKDVGGKDWDRRVAGAWPLFWKYFDGRSALERIALQEEMKRKDVWNLLTAMSEYLLTVRHW